MDLKLITELNESSQYRSKSAFNQSTARTVCDHAFMDMIAIWILFNEFEFAPIASNYANKTVTFNRFSQYRQMGTDLYLNLHVISEKRTDLVGSSADAQLFDRIQLDVPAIVRYLRSVSRNSINPGIVRQTLQRLEQSLHISNSNYRSVRRLAQSWPTLQTGQKRTVITRMLFFYQMNARRSEMYGVLKELAKSNNLVDPNANNPETSALKTAAAAGAAAAAGFAGGYQLGKGLV
jgi:hypothetical protein